MKSIIQELNANSKSIDKLEIFINYKFQNLYDFFSNQTKWKIFAYKFDLESYLTNNLKIFRQLDFSSDINFKFIVMLIEACDKLEMYMLFQTLFKLLKRKNYSFEKKLEAQSLYIMNIRRFGDYQNKYKEFIDTLNIAFTDEEEAEETLTNISINFYLRILNDFGEYNKEDVLKFKFDYMEYYNSKNYKYLDRNFVKLIFNIDITNAQEAYDNIQKIISDYLTQNEKEICNIGALSIENSDYSKQLYSLHNPIFNDIKKISVEYINNIDNKKELFNKLDRGRYIIDTEELLYQYIFSYSTMHKLKLYESFKVISENLKNITIDIIDWGCGQALATTFFIEYIKENNLNIDIKNITLIEPSKLALSRGLLHLDVLKKKTYKINAINKDLDCIEQNDIKINSQNIVLHLFSNILDAEFFKLDMNFLEKISNNIKNDNYFVCVSPNINVKRNDRLDIFYKYFTDNFDTKLISARDTNIDIYTRYEKLFKVKYIKQEEILKAREKIKDYHVDIYTKFATYASILEPTLNTERLRENIENDPDYVIFKIRKVAEIITSKIFMNNGGEDESRVSQNDKIRYLSFDKKVLSRKAQSHLHTIRTIGNIGTHDHIENPIKMLKDDAYFLSTALILLIEDLQENKII